MTCMNYHITSFTVVNVCYKLVKRMLHTKHECYAQKKTVMCRDHGRLAGYAVVTQVCHGVGVLPRTQYQ